MKKNIITLVICISLTTLVIINLDKITTTISSFVTSNEPQITEKISEYQKDYSLSYLSEAESFIPYSYQDLMNIIYTTINNRWTNFTFYCPSEYEDCEIDMLTLSQDSSTLTHINNFVHPYNSFDNIRITTSDSGEINFLINYLYSLDKVNLIDEEVDRLLLEFDLDGKSDEKKIEYIHDYIIENAQYDVAVNKNEETIYDSSTAYGPLFEGVAICNGYTDLMAIFLTKLGYKNLKVATTPDEISYANTGHIWNIVYLNDEWLHLDLTWDDPILDDDLTKSFLYHHYFLVTTEELHEADERDENAPVLEEHHFDTSIYYELKS